MYNNNQKSKQGFPDPLEPTEVKEGKEYGIQYAKAIESQWGNTTDDSSLVGKRNRVFEKDRDYATGVQDTSIYKQLLNSLQPNKGDGSLLNIDYTPVPILPKFVRIVVNKILSINPYPNLEAIDPVSSSEKNLEKNRIQLQVKQKEKLKQLKEKSGITLDMDPDQIPETLEEAEIFYETNVKTTGEISAQLGTELTLNWNGFADSTFRRCVNDLATLGMSVVKRSNDPNEGIKVSYVDPSKFIHSYTEDPNFDDLIYAGHIKKISISELKRIASHELTEEDFKEIAKKSRGKNGNDASKYEKKYFNDRLGRTSYGYDDYMVHVLDFEFMSVDCMNFEEKENKFGNTGFYFKGFNYKPQKNSVFERKPHKMEISTVYGGSYILGCDYLFNYGRSKNIPKNIHDISKARLSYSVVSTNIRNMIPKSMVDSCVGFADMLQLTHLKIQQAIAKAKPDGLIIDIEGLENVQLGKGGELQPLDLHDIYEQTGVFYYRSKNAEGGFQNPPVREIGNSIRNINELIGLYNHYLRLIRDTTGINEAMDASSPKGDALVGVQQQAIAAGNNAIYDITNASLMLYKKVCEDIVKCLQIIPSGSVLYNVYENAIGKTNMKALKSFKDLPMYNFGVVVVKDMEEKEKAFLEQNIQMALQQKEIDLEDAIAVRSLKDINQAERLLIVRRKKRMAMMQQMAMQQSQQQAQQQAQLAQQAQEAKMAQMKAEAELDAQKTQMEAEISMKMEQMKHEFRREIEMIKAQATLGFKEDDKDERLTKQTSDQSKLISQRQGKRQEIEGDGASLINELLKQ